MKKKVFKKLDDHFSGYNFLQNQYVSDLGPLRAKASEGKQRIIDLPDTRPSSI